MRFLKRLVFRTVRRTLEDPALVSRIQAEVKIDGLTDADELIIYRSVVRVILRELRQALGLKVRK